MWLTQMHAMTQITVEVALFATKIEKTMWKWGWLLTEIHFLGLEATVVHQQIRVKLQEEGCKNSWKYHRIYTNQYMQCKNLKRYVKMSAPSIRRSGAIIVAFLIHAWQSNTPLEVIQVNVQTHECMYKFIYICYNIIHYEKI